MCSPAAAPAPTSQNVTNTTVPDYLKGTVERMVGKAESLADTPYQAYGGQRIADFNDLQKQAFQGAQNMQVAPQMGQASNMAAVSGIGSLNAGQNYANMATNPGSMQSWMSPYMSGVTNVQQQEAQRQAGIANAKLQGQAAMQGSFGGARHGIEEAEANRNLATQLGSIQATGLQNAYQAATQAQQFGANLGLQGYGQANTAANTLGTLGNQQFNQQQNILATQQAAGNQQQQLEQQRLQQQYQDFLTQRGYPQQQLSFLSDMVHGLPMSQSTQTQYTAPPSTTSQIAGLGIGALGLSNLVKP